MWLVSALHPPLNPPASGGKPLPPRLRGGLGWCLKGLSQRLWGDSPHFRLAPRAFTNDAGWRMERASGVIHGGEVLRICRGNGRRAHP